MIRSDERPDNITDNSASDCTSIGNTSNNDNDTVNKSTLLSSNFCKTFSQLRSTPPNEDGYLFFVLRDSSVPNHFRWYSDEASVDNDVDFLTRHYTIQYINNSNDYYLFIDVDSKEASADQTITHLQHLYPSSYKSVETAKGYHIYSKYKVNKQRHIDILTELQNSGFKGIDTQAVLSLRIPGTYDRKRKFRSKLEGKLTDYLICEAGPFIQNERANTTNATPIKNKEIRHILESATNDVDSFSMPTENSNQTTYTLPRVYKSFCYICDREHDRQYVKITIPIDKPVIFINCGACKASNGNVVLQKHTYGIEDTSIWTSGDFESNDKFKIVDYDPHKVPRPIVSPDVPIYADGSHCGIGKTLTAINNERLRNKATVLISYRIAYSCSQLTRFQELENIDVMLYSDIKGDINIKKNALLIIQYESLHRIKTTPDIVIIDEEHGINRHAIHSNKHDYTKFCIYHELLARASGVILLDADLHNTDIELYERIIKRPIYCIRNDFKIHNDKTVNIIPYKKKPNGETQTSSLGLKNMIIKYIKYRMNQTDEWRSNNKFVIFAEARTAVESWTKTMSKYNIKYKRYHGQTDQIEKHNDFMNWQTSWEGIECIIHNTTLEAGVSITDPRFNTWFGFFTNIASAEVLRQSICRFRCITSFYVSFSGHTYGYPDTEEKINHIIRNKHLYIKEHLKLDVPSILQIEHDDPNSMGALFGKFWMKAIMESNRSKNAIQGRLVALLSKSGFKIVKDFDDTQVFNTKPVEKPKVSNTPILSLAERIANASVKHYQKLKDADGYNKQDKLNGYDLECQIKFYRKQIYEVKEEDITVAFCTKFNSDIKDTAFKRLKSTRNLIKKFDSLNEYLEGIWTPLNVSARIPEREANLHRDKWDEINNNRMEIESKTLKILQQMKIDITNLNYKHKLGNIKKVIHNNTQTILELKNLISGRDVKASGEIKRPIETMNYILSHTFCMTLHTTSESGHDSDYVIPCTEVDELIRSDELKELPSIDILDQLDKDTVLTLNKDYMKGKDALRKQEERAYTALTALFHAPPGTLPRRGGRPKKQ
jgi:hypothetical protein